MDNQETNPYLDELKKIVETVKRKPPAGFPRKIREYRRARNFRARSSRRINRLRAKGKNV